MLSGPNADYAVQLLAKGYICVPLRSGGKHLDLESMDYNPLHLQTRRKNLKELAFRSVAFQLSQRPPTSDDVSRWFQNSSGNIGIVGGYANLLILDFDKVSGYRDWSRMHQSLAERTPLARSPNGFHVYLRTEEPTISSSLYSGLRRVGHVKALGGYVVASPSMLRDGSSYEWVQGRSPFDVDPQPIASLADISLRSVAPLKRVYDRLLDRGFFEAQ
ncbi:bifunctional DNA primase/polymerase [Mesorhizobium sp. ES1-1]|uniref:bifunctional DNA primase/polymerase n=1 Tax=Mesorhizobium sp. ES1-1 TaxID=2876629 RepID=UPI001CCFF143|nr:bifunctional DNA primase/polymerase [Mesorhizobium sp. ES1-1]MBZ9676469.1 bifunctional DNA primase/polymerase [Mesorhizobium sp. ES1-1]